MAGRKPQRWYSLKIALLTGALLAPAGTIGQTSSAPAFSGRAFVVQANVPPLSPITIADTGPLPSGGGAEEASLLEVSPISMGNVGALNGADVAHATTVGQGNASRSEALLADLSLTVAGNTIAADFLMSTASAQCNGSTPSVSGNSELARVVVNGQPVVISGATNQRVPLPLGAGSIVINEQSSSVSGQSGTLDVNALHVVATNPTTGMPLADVILAHAHADIACPASPASPPPCSGGSSDFVTGGGVIPSPTDPNAKANFAVAGGVKNGFWGHLLYIDHGTPGARAKGTAVTGYTVLGPTTRQIDGQADASGMATSGHYTAVVTDGGEPGRGVDHFALTLPGYAQPDVTLDGGNIQLHCK